MEISKLIDQYGGGAIELRLEVAGMDQAQLRARPIPGKWSTLEVLCHLTDFDIIYADRMKRVIVEDEPPLRGGDPGAFAARLAYEARHPEEEMAIIHMIRRQMCKILRTLKPEDFQRRGIHSESGPLTLQTLLERITAHIPHHVRFIQEKRAAMP